MGERIEQGGKNETMALYYFGSFEFCATSIYFKGKREEEVERKKNRRERQAKSCPGTEKLSP